MTDESKKRRRFDSCTIPSSFAGLPELPDQSIADRHRAGLNTLLTRCLIFVPSPTLPVGREKRKKKEKTPSGVFFSDPPKRPQNGSHTEWFCLLECLRGCHRPPLAPMLFAATSSAAFLQIYSCPCAGQIFASQSSHILTNLPCRYLLFLMPLIFPSATHPPVLTIIIPHFSACLRSSAFWHSILLLSDCKGKRCAIRHPCNPSPPK